MHTLRNYKIDLVLLDNAGKTIYPKPHKFCWSEGKIIKKRKCKTYFIPEEEESFQPWIGGGLALSNSTCDSYVSITPSDLDNSKKIIINTIYFADPDILEDLGQSEKIDEYSTQNCIDLLPEFRKS